MSLCKLRANVLPGYHYNVLKGIGVISIATPFHFIHNKPMIFYLMSIVLNTTCTYVRTVNISVALEAVGMSSMHGLCVGGLVDGVSPWR